MRYFRVTPLARNGSTSTLPSPRLVRISLLSVVCVWGAVFLAFEGNTAWYRTVQQYKRGAVFQNGLQIHGLEGVRWGEPAVIGGTATLRKAEFERLYNYLAVKRGNFFVMGDSTLLYGLLRCPSPKPLLYFQPGHSFLEQEIPQIDEVLVDSLAQNGVEVVVREKVTFMPGGHEVYARFPRTWAWFRSRFEHVSDFGIYEIWERRDRPR